MTTIQNILFEHQDEKYGDFIAKLIPTEKREVFIGIRSPEYKKILTSVYKLPQNDIETFLKELPHRYHEENALHIALINNMDYEKGIEQLESFLPYITNWAISDGLSPKAFSKNLDNLSVKIKEWLSYEHPYAKRVGMLLIMKYLLKESFKPDYLDWAAEIRSDDYYVNMMTAWLFAEALYKQWDTAVEYIKTNRLATWTHNKAIQKARESSKFTLEQKEYLKTLKISKF